ncbi:MAG: ADP-ribosyltransferase [Bacteriovorax sp.]|nr:ADP-ribosyltransferase [Bacteriovorax sp.]
MKFKSLIIFIFIVLSFDLYAFEYKTYRFDDLSHQLGYPSETYFGSGEDEIQDLETYSSKEDNFYKEINNYLRIFPRPYEWTGTSPEKAKIIVANIDKIFTKIPSIPQELILFRGVDLKYRNNKSFTIGEEFVDKGYVSTSTSFKIANYFATEINGESSVSKKAIFVLYQNLPDQKGILIDQNEDEVLLKHGQVLKVMSTRKTNSAYETYLVQACKNSCDKQMDKDIETFWKSFKEN